MASTTNTTSNNVETDPVDTKIDNSSSETDPKTLPLPLEQNDARVTDPDGAQSPASSTYADCEETGSPVNEHLHDVSEEIAETVPAEVIFELSTEKVEVNNCIDSTDSKPVVTSVNSTTVEEKFVPDDPDKSVNTNNEKPDVVNECVNDKHISDENVNGDINNESDQPENYDDVNCRKSPLQDETATSEGSDFDSDEQENDRENGDGQEVVEEDVVAQKKLDDDEDRRNPQYIPKRGFFYEHDNRTVGTSSDEETEEGKKKKAEAKEPERKGRGRQSVPDGRWQHDLYREDEQRPKSTQELIDIYGYDIRNEESAPKARRRRKYGRGPNKYTRQWENEEAYAKQVSTKGKRGGQNQRLPRQRDEYENEFPSLSKERTARPQARSRDRREVTPKRSVPRESSRSDTETRFKDERRSYEIPAKAVAVAAAATVATVATAANAVPTTSLERSRSFTHRVQANRDGSMDRERSRSRSFSRRIPANRDRSAPKYESIEKGDIRRIQKPLRKSVVVATNTIRSRGRGIPIGRNPRYGNSSVDHSTGNNNYDGESRSYESRVQFTAANRGRGQQFMRPNQPNYPSKQNASDDDVHDLSYKMANVDLKSVRRTIINRSVHPNDVELLKSTEPTQQQPLPGHGTTTIRSKRYSQQRHRLLPDSSAQNTLTNVNNSMAATVAGVQTMAPTQQRMPTMTTSNCNVQQVDVSAQLPQQQSKPQLHPQQHSSITYLPQETQMRTAPPPPQTNDPTRTVTAVNTSAIPSSSLAVSASLIPLSAPPLTAAGTALSSGAPPLPIVGFFQHPQGYTNQAAPAQLYSGEQTVMGGPSNQPVQLLAFLPASPMMQSTNHTQTGAPPPPPPPPPTFAGQVMSYPQPAPTQQPQPSFNSETYSLPPVSLAPMPQAPEMYQSRGGVTYYNTRSQYKPRSPPPPRVKIAIPIVPPPSNELAK